MDHGTLLKIGCLLGHTLYLIGQYANCDVDPLRRILNLDPTRGSLLTPRPPLITGIFLHRFRNKYVENPKCLLNGRLASGTLVQISETACGVGSSHVGFTEVLLSNLIKLRGKSMMGVPNPVSYSGCCTCVVCKVALGVLLVVSSGIGLIWKETM